MKQSRYIAPLVASCLLHTCAFAAVFVFYGPSATATKSQDEPIRLKLVVMQESAIPAQSPEPPASMVIEKSKASLVKPVVTKAVNSIVIKKKMAVKTKQVIARKYAPEPARTPVVEDVFANSNIEQGVTVPADVAVRGIRNASFTTQSSGISPAVQQVVVLDLPEPKYPKSAIRREQEGTVILQVEVRKDGSLAHVQVVKTSSYKKLDNAAIKAVERAKFKPAMKENVAIFSSTQISITFRLENS